ncbi:MAG TPA: HAD family phosphatase [Sedimentisphaerales bacterium]|nr:HAD family phosphatase [Sedimentisphaerales bacterium]
MFRAVIFDFDGVITDSEVLHLRAFNQSLVPYGVEISTKDYYTNYLGFSDIDCYKALIDNGLLKIDERQIDSIIKEKSKIFEELTKTEGRTIEGVHEFLQMLEENNIPMAICSGSLLVEIEVMLEESNLRHFFAAIVSAEQVKKGKPHPEGFLLSLQKINETCHPPIAANECIVIEDSHWGMQAGKAAGMHTVAVTNSYEAEQLSLAEKIVSHLNELTINDLQQLCA